MTTYPLATLAATVSDTGITAPSYADILASLKASYQLIFGADAYLEPDSQDGQLLAVFAQGIYDSNLTAIAVYNQFSPSTSIGTGLSSVVKINGIERLVPTNSTVACQVIGVAGTILTSCLVQDVTGYQWSLPTTTIPPGGSVTVTATAVIIGAIPAAAGAVTIVTPTLGWQSASFVSAATTGNPVELDATLRNRQSVSTALPAQSIMGGLYGALANIVGVTQLKVYENDDGIPDANGLPGHSIAVVIQGGNSATIAQTIEQKKTPGTATYGTTSVTVNDPIGVPVPIHFFIPNQKTIVIEMTIHALTGYTSSTGTAIITALVAAINNMGIAANNGLLSLTMLYAAAYSVPNANTFNITALAIAISPFTPAAADLTIPFNALPICAPGNVTLTVI